MLHKIKNSPDIAYIFYSIRKSIEHTININEKASTLTNPTQSCVHHNNILLTRTLYLAIRFRTIFSCDFLSQTEHNRVSLGLFMCVSCRGRSARDFNSQRQLSRTLTFFIDCPFLDSSSPFPGVCPLMYGGIENNLS